MRISDWSSDVGSSDLAALVQARSSRPEPSCRACSQVARQPVRRAASRCQGRREAAVQHQSGEGGDVARQHAVVVEEGGALAERRLDWKSDVLGKSVSVRVDLGVGRIINKNKT